MSVHDRSHVARVTVFVCSRLSSGLQPPGSGGFPALLPFPGVPGFSPSASPAALSGIHNPTMQSALLQVHALIYVRNVNVIKATELQSLSSPSVHPGSPHVCVGELHTSAQQLYQLPSRPGKSLPPATRPASTVGLAVRGIHGVLRNAPNYSSVLKLTNSLSSSEAGKTPLQLTRSICDVEVFSHFTVRVTFTTNEQDNGEGEEKNISYTQTVEKQGFNFSFIVCSCKYCLASRL